MQLAAGCCLTRLKSKCLSNASLSRVPPPHPAHTSLPPGHRLCEECSSLIDNQDQIKVLSLTHANISKVLAEIGDIVDLPSRAEMVLSLLDDPANILPAFEALTVLEGTAENAKAAWNRCEWVWVVRMRDHNVSCIQPAIQAWMVLKGRAERFC